MYVLDSIQQHAIFRRFEEATDEKDKALLDALPEASVVPK